MAFLFHVTSKLSISSQRQTCQSEVIDTRNDNPYYILHKSKTVIIQTDLQSNASPLKTPNTLKIFIHATLDNRSQHFSGNPLPD